MPTYNVKCDDGSSAACTKTVEIELDAELDSDEDAEEYMDENNILFPICPPCRSESSFDSDGNLIPFD